MFFSKPFHTSLVIDFGSTSIGVALVARQITKKGEPSKPQIIFQHREWVLSVKKPEAVQFLTSMQALLDRALEVVQKKGIPILKKTCHKSSIDTINCIYASPWYISQSHQINISNDKEIEFTEKILDTLIASEEKKLRESTEELKIIDKKVTHIRLNGYDTVAPFGKFAKQISATLYVCLLQSKIISGVEAGVRKRINSHAITHHSFSLAAYTAIRDYYQQENFLILDIGGEVTDVNIVKDGSLRYEVSFPYGKNFVLRKISEKNNVEPEIALSKVKMALDDSSTDEHTEDITNRFHAIKVQWASAFQNALSSVENNFIPKHIFVTCDPDVQPFFTEILTKKELSQSMLMIEPFVLQAITPELFNSALQVSPDVKEDVFLSIDAYFVNSINYK